MKQLILVLALTAVVIACQPTDIADNNLTASAIKTAVVPTPTAAAHQPPTVLADSLSAVLLQRYNLASVLQTTHQGQNETAVQQMNGFFGADRYRIEVVITRVTRDTQRPGYYQVQGKDRCKGRIMPFTGTLNFTSMQLKPHRASTPESYPDEYVALGIFELHELASHSGTGIFRGQIAADVSVEKDGQLNLFYPGVDTPAKGGGITYDGTWTSNTTGQTTPAVWVVAIFDYRGPQVFRDFAVGERGTDFNPKYAKLGWNHYWENDEWWAASPKPVLGL